MTFGVTALWPTFDAEPYAKSTFKFTLAFSELFFETTGWFKSKLDRGDH